MNRGGAIADRLSVTSLGLALVPLTGAAWGSGLPYLLARLGLAPPAGLGWTDGVHVYVGLVGAVLIAGKALRVGLGYRVRGVRRVVRWQRWVSWSLLALYGAVFVSGGLLLLPVHGRLYGDLVELHLMTAVWALALTTWHVWHHRHRAAPVLRGFLEVRPRRLRLGAAFAVAATPALVLLANPRSASQLPEVMAGSSWSQAGPTGIPLARITTTPGDGALLAAGNGVYASRDGRAWRAVDFLGGSGGAAFLPGGHGAPHAHATATAVQSIAASRDGIYVGTAQGLFFSATLDGPLVDLGFPGQDVEGVAVDPSDPHVLWTASTAGAMRSSDGGRSWARLVGGLAQPERVSSVAYMGARVFASDTTGVFEWGAGSTSWLRSSSQPSVIELSASPDGRQLYAVSSAGQVRQLSAGGWRTLASPGAAHRHDGQAHAHPAGVVPFAGRLFAAGTPDGVSASADGGLTWARLGGGIAASTPTGVAAFRGSLWAATSTGAYRYLLSPSAPASATWWAGLVAGAAVVGLIILALVGIERSGRGTSAGRQRQDRPFRGFEDYLSSLGGDPAAVGRAGEPRPPRTSPGGLTSRPRVARPALFVGGLLLGAILVSAASLGGLGPWAAGAAGAGSRPAHSSPPTNGPSRALFRDDFEKDPVGASPPAGWSAPDGRWDGVVADAGHVLRHAPGPSYGHLVAGSRGWTDYAASVDVRATSLSTGFAGVAGRYQGPGDYYLCDIHDAAAVQLWRLRGGSGTLLGGRQVTIDSSRFHSLRLVMRGAQLSCALDGALMFAGTDSTFRDGGIALVASDDEAAEFDNVAVTD